MVLFLTVLFLAWLGPSPQMPTPSTKEDISGDYYVPQALSSFSYVIEMKDWNGVDPIQKIKQYYQDKNVPAVIVYADYADGLKLSQTTLNVGNAYSPSFVMAATKTAEEALSNIDPKNPKAGAEGTLIVIYGTGKVRAIASAISNYFVASGAVIDHNAYVDIFKGITHQIPRQ